MNIQASDDLKQNVASTLASNTLNGMALKIIGGCRMFKQPGHGVKVIKTNYVI